MTDTKQETTPAIADTPAFRAAAAKYGITRAEVVAPKPVVTHKVNLDQLCTRTDPVLDDDGSTLQGIEGHTGPLMFIGAKEFSADTQQSFKQRYENYVGFYTITAFKPTADGGQEIVITHGIPVEGPTEVMQHLAKLDRGNLFQIAMYRTSGGNRLFKPVPVQTA